MFSWGAVVIGPIDTPYANGVFNVDIAFPATYPFKAPNVKFVTKVYHPNINSASGEICADVLKDWKPTLNVRFVLEVLHSMLSEPSPEGNLEPEIAKVLQDDPEKFNATATEWTKQYAM